MARLSRAQTDARDRLTQIAAMAGAPGYLAGEIADTLQQAVGWDGFRMFGIDPGTGLINRVLAASVGDDDTREEWLRDVYLQASEAGLGFIELGFLAREQLRAVAFQDRLELCHGYPAHVLNARLGTEYTRSFYENHAPVGGTILANFHSGDRWVASLQAYRRDQRSPFRAGDVAFVRLVAPQVADILLTALEREAAAAPTVPAPAAASGIILVERTGRLRYATPAGEAWFDALRSVPGEGNTRLPASLWGAIAGLNAGAGRAVSVVRLPSGTATIEASPGGDEGAIALVVTPVRTPTAFVPPAAWGLTSAEERVAALVVQGHGNRSISDQLSVSEHTIEWHLGRIFDKLEIRSRGQLTARCFRDTGLPAVVSQRIA